MGGRKDEGVWKDLRVETARRSADRNSKKAKSCCFFQLKELCYLSSVGEKNVCVCVCNDDKFTVQGSRAACGFFETASFKRER